MFGNGVEQHSVLLIDFRVVAVVQRTGSFLVPLVVLLGEVLVGLGKVCVCRAYVRLPVEESLRWVRKYFDLERCYSEELLVVQPRVLPLVSVQQERPVDDFNGVQTGQTRNLQQLA